MFAFGCSEGDVARHTRGGAHGGREERGARGSPAQRVPDAHRHPERDAHQHLQLAVPRARRLRRCATLFTTQYSVLTLLSSHSPFPFFSSPLLSHLHSCTISDSPRVRSLQFAPLNFGLRGSWLSRDCLWASFGCRVEQLIRLGWVIASFEWRVLISRTSFRFTLIRLPSASALNGRAHQVERSSYFVVYSYRCTLIVYASEQQLNICVCVARAHCLLSIRVALIWRLQRCVPVPAMFALLSSRGTRALAFRDSYSAGGVCGCVCMCVYLIADWAGLEWNWNGRDRWW